jgi:hypothetical protein
VNQLINQGDQEEREKAYKYTREKIRRSFGEANEYYWP